MMGACEIRDTAVAESAKKAFERLVDDARWEHGNDAYNGTWTTCGFRHVIEKFDGKATKSSVAKARKIFDKLFRDDKIDKRTAFAVDCGVDHYELISVKRTKAKGRPKQKFVVMYYDDNGREREKRSFGNMKDADAMAKAIALDGNESFVRVRCSYDGGIDAVQYTLVAKTLKSRPKRVPANAKLVEYHLYYFGGLAAE